MSGFLHYPTRRVVLVAGASGVALAACSNVIGPTNSAAQIYVLAPQSQALPDIAKVWWGLSIARFDTAASLDTDRIAIRRDETMDYYADAQWADSAPLLLQSLLVEAFEKSDRIAAVAKDSDGIQAEYILQCELRDFEARYADPNGAPTVVVDVMAKLLVAHDRSIAAVHDARRETPAAANSVVAAVAAFNASTAAVLEEIVAWALTSAPEPKPADPAAPAPKHGHAR